jgi:hypothetical protein
MAKVTAPLMSMTASGKFGGALVFTTWKGRPTVRQLVIPTNRKSAGQVATRNAISVLGAGQHFASVTALKRSGETTTDRVELGTLAPSGQAWNGFLVKSAIGTDMVAYDDATAAYAALASNEKAAWVAAAAALTPAIPAVAQRKAGGGYDTPMTDGEVYFHYAWGLYVAGAMAAAPSATPPTYA